MSPPPDRRKGRKITWEQVVPKSSRDLGGPEAHQV